MRGHTNLCLGPSPPLYLPHRHSHPQKLPPPPVATTTPTMQPATTASHIKLICADQQVVSFPSELAQYSSVIHNILIDLGEHAATEGIPIFQVCPLPLYISLSHATSPVTLSSPLHSLFSPARLLAYSPILCTCTRATNARSKLVHAARAAQSL